MNCKKIKKLLQTKKIVLYLILLIIFLIGIGIVVIGFLENKSLTIYNYQITRDSDYKVYLKENNFYQEEYLKPNNYYPALAIANYNIMLKYNFSGDIKTNMTYRYQIKASLIGNLKTNNGLEKRIWVYNFNLKPIKEVKVNDKKITIFENVVIDYNYYNELKNAYERKYGVLLDAYLNISLEIETKLDLSSLKYKDLNNYKINDKVIVKIYLGDNVSYASKDYLKEENENIKSIKEVKYFNYYLGGSLIGITGILFIFLFLKDKNMFKKSYEKQIKKIFKDYNELMVTIKSKPDLGKLKIIQLISFEDLIDVALLHNTNILYYEEVINYKSNLYVIVNDYAYLYIIKKD